MARERGLMQRGGRWSVVVAVPRDLQDALGAKQVWRSLRTADKGEARRRAVQVRAEIEAGFDRKRLELSDAASRRVLDDGHVEAIARNLHDFEIDADDRERHAKLDDPSWHDPSWQAAEMTRMRQAYVKAMQDDLNRGRFHHVTWFVDAVIERDRLPVVPDTPDYRRLAHACQRAMIDATRIKIARDGGDYTTRPVDPIITAPPRKPKRPAPGESILDLLVRYRDLNATRIKPDTIRQVSDAVGLFASFHPDVTVAEITRPMVREWRDALVQYPARAARTAAFKGLPMREAIARNAEIGNPPLSPKTVYAYLSGLSAFLTWAIREGHREDGNPVSGLQPVRDKAPKVRSFTTDELDRVFRSDWFTGERDHRFWLPLVCLFTGMRLGEAAQLRTADVREHHDRWIIHVTDEAADQSVKTEGSRRMVPIHNELVALGFLEHVARQEGERVFPTAKMSTTKAQWCPDVSRDFGRLLARLDIGPDERGRKVGFHALRHTFADGLRKIDVDDAQIGLLLGHRRSSMTSRYGVDQATMLERKSAMIDALKYGLDFAHLRP